MNNDWVYSCIYSISQSTLTRVVAQSLARLGVLICFRFPNTPANPFGKFSQLGNSCETGENDLAVREVVWGFERAWWDTRVSHSKREMIILYKSSSPVEATKKTPRQAGVCLCVYSVFLSLFL